MTGSVGTYKSFFFSPRQPCCSRLCVLLPSPSPASSRSAVFRELWPAPIQRRQADAAAGSGFPMGAQPRSRSCGVSTSASSVAGISAGIPRGPGIS
jgi:hypothetical protein